MEAIPSLVCLIYFTLPFESLGDLSIETVLVGTTVYAIHFIKFKITSSAIPKPSAFFQNSRKQVICKQGSNVSPVYAHELFENVQMIQIGISDWPRQGQRPPISYPFIFSPSLKV